MLNKTPQGKNLKCKLYTLKATNIRNRNRFGHKQTKIPTKNDI